MADEPCLTRWSFEVFAIAEEQLLILNAQFDFKLYYEIKFGRKKDSAAEDVGENGQAVCSGNSSTVISNGNGHVKNTLDLSIFEQYNQANNGSSAHSNGLSSAGGTEKPQRSLLPPFESAEMRALGESLIRDIIRGSPDVKWESIKGLENAKRLLKEAVVMPIKYPKYFTGLLSPWKGILLFGPPGTGKTMLAKAVATECNTTFFNISASSVVSKWRGDSEKLIKVLFDLARHHAPSTIFLDEIDAITANVVKHVVSMKLMDGLTRTDELVFVLAATNLPWELDAAMLRRLEKRILVPLPEPEARRAMFKELLSSTPEEETLPYDLLVEKTEGFSGSDIRLLCKEAAMQPLRRLIAQLEEKQEVVPEDELPKVGQVTERDIEMALKNTRPSAHLHAHRYDKFNSDYGSQVLQ
ncbi:hypothetical protein RND71_035450 [Anisodus tanguticus]|uniref:AAA+ ATPase domain-containing protein n=1 Tax=Anisodus tanguticus TaxID=243964 RepID=A0AAE1R5V3_9SOLA|nr:hypothetical protein RND71_035450 [Anisodus tanguticus]